MRILNGGHLALGVTIGVCSIIILFFALEYFGSVLTPDSTVWAAMIGAIVGGGISLAGQVLEAENQRFHRQADLERINVANAYTLFETLLNLHANFIAIKKHCIRQLEEAEKVRQRAKYLGIIPLSGRSRPPSIPIECKVLLMSTHATDLYNRINNVDQFTLNLLDHFDDLQGRRLEILQLFDVQKTVGKMEMSLVGGKKQEFEARYNVLETNFVLFLSNIDEIALTLEGCLDDTTKLIKRLGDEKFGFELRVV